MRATDKAWAAGFIDGEGYLHLQPVSRRRSDGYRNRKPRIEVAQANLVPLYKLRSMFGGSIVKIKRYGDVKRKTAWRWDLCGGRPVRRAVKCVIPYLTVKHWQALLLLEFIETMKLGRFNGRGGRRPRLLRSVETKRQRIFDKMKKDRKGG